MGPLVCQRREGTSCLSKREGISRVPGKEGTILGRKPLMCWEKEGTSRLPEEGGDLSSESGKEGEESYRQVRRRKLCSRFTLPFYILVLFSY